MKIKYNLYRKNGYTISSLCSKCNVRHEVIKYITRLIDKYGYDILRTTKNKYHNALKKKIIVGRVLINNEPINLVAIDEGLLSRGILSNWIKKHQEDDYNIVERNRVKSST